jgi:hypothetical protein
VILSLTCQFNAGAQAAEKNITDKTDARVASTEAFDKTAGINVQDRELNDENLSDMRGQQFTLDSVLKAIGHGNLKEAWRYGNYGGADWSNGAYVQNKKQPAMCVAAADKLDAVFAKHDFAYTAADKEKDSKKRAEKRLNADKQLAKDLLNLKLDPKATYFKNYDYALQAQIQALGYFGDSLHDSDKIFGKVRELAIELEKTGKFPTLTTIIAADKVALQKLKQKKNNIKTGRR